MVRQRCNANTYIHKIYTCPWDMINYQSNKKHISRWLFITIIIVYISLHLLYKLIVKFINFLQALFIQGICLFFFFQGHTVTQGNRLPFISILSIWVSMPNTLPTSTEEEYGHTLQEHPHFQTKCAPTNFNHVVTENTITFHTWAGVIVFPLSNTNNTMHVTILLSVTGG